MAYTIARSDNTTLPIIIQDGALDTTSTNLSLPGPNFVGYGQYLNQNLVHLLENFSSNSKPGGTNVQGQLWFDKFHQRLNVFTLNGFVPVSGITNSRTQPIITNDGEFWFDTFNNQFYVSNGDRWNLIGPQYSKSQGVSGAIPITVTDGVTNGITHNVIQIQYGTSIIATISSDSFTPKNYDPGFPVIYSGLTINSNVSATQQQPVSTGALFTASLTTGNVTSTNGYYWANGVSIFNTISSTNISAANITASGNVYSNGNIAMVSSVLRNVYVNSVAPSSTQGNVGDIWYQTF
jgi:hypothetical protein